MARALLFSTTVAGAAEHLSIIGAVIREAGPAPCCSPSLLLGRHALRYINFAGVTWRFYNYQHDHLSWSCLTSPVNDLTLYSISNINY